MTALSHVRFSFTLVVDTDLHIGDGRMCPLETLRPGLSRRRTADDPAQAEDTGPLVKTIVRDHDKRPILPATSLKGVLKEALTGSLDKAEIDRLFGTITGGKHDKDGKTDKRDKTDSGQMGRFTFHAAVLDRSDSPSTFSGLPYFDDTAGTWVATHVAISRNDGTADPRKLFNMEMVPAGGRFLVDGIWFGDMEDAKLSLPRLLAPLRRPDGVSIGSGGRIGRGRVSLGRAADVRLWETAFNPKTGLVDTTPGKSPVILTVPKTAMDGAVKILDFTCDGPFASVDPSPRPGDNRGNLIRSLGRDDARPVIHPDGVSGALRSRAAWLSALHDLGGDDRFRKPETWADPEELTPVERLFGVTGWRGLLRQSFIKQPVAAEHTHYTSVALDAFTGGVLDSTLFEHEVYVGVSFSLALSLDRRVDDDNTPMVTQGDRNLLELLLDDVTGDVLPLGHATNRGFGWFSVTHASPERSAR
ncbi:RAMP superfamily CRISPR-associated protein [Rhodospirillum sp. A1_3_36]|uniref:RAMP superfamily CRISPR-associated protein n=1 Tax=Rhodospirillum sp. A1_3_36 TaxID=3391666 RepID=UPI0039A6EBAE